MYTENIVAVHPLGLDTLRVRYYCILRPNTSETELNYLAEKHSFFRTLTYTSTCTPVHAHSTQMKVFL